MSGLADVIRGAVAGLDTILADAGFQGFVTHQAWKGYKDTHGTPDHDGPVQRLALIHEGSNQVRLQNGDSISTKACISFLRPVPDHGAPGRREPIDPRDKITLPSGTTGLLVESPGALIDPTTGRRYINVFWLQ